MSFFYDTDTDPNNGREYIASDIDASDMSFAWDCSTIPDGDYYILAIIEDGVGHKNAVYINTKKVTSKPPSPYIAYDYSDGKLSIKHAHNPPTITVTEPSAQGAETDRSYTIRWTFTSYGSSPTVALYFDNDTNSNNGKTKIADSITASNLNYTWDCSAIPEGSYYILAVIDDNLGSSYHYKRIEKQREVTPPFYIVPPVKGYVYVKVPTTAEDYSDGKLTIKHILLATLTGHTGWVNSVTFNPTNGSRCMSGSSDNNLKYWNLTNGECIHTYYGHKKTVNSVFISPDGLYCFSGTDTDPSNQSLKYWNIETGNAQTFDSSEQTNLSVAISREGTYGLVGHYQAIATLWKMDEAKAIMVFQSHIDRVYAVAFGLTYRDIFTGSGDKTIVLWNLNGSVKHTFMGHTGPVRSIVVSPDGNILISGSDDKTIRIWDINNGQLKSTYNYGAAVMSVSVSQDGKYILSGGDDKNMKLWDFNNGNCLSTFWAYRFCYVSCF